MSLTLTMECLEAKLSECNDVSRKITRRSFGWLDCPHLLEIVKSIVCAYKHLISYTNCYFMWLVKMI